MVALTKDGKCNTHLVHDLILETFVGPKPIGMEGRHWDGDKANNSLGNLCWGTRSQNEADKVRHGKSNRGSRHGMAKLTESEVLAIRQRHRNGETGIAMAKDLGMDFGHIYRILRREMWRHI